MRAVKNNTSTLVRNIPGIIGMLIIVTAVVAVIAIFPGRSSSTAPAPTTPGTIMKFTTMVGVDGPFVDSKVIRGVKGDELPWEVGNVNGSLTADGHIKLSVTGVVFADYPSVPANLRGINDEERFRALVSCLTENE